MEQYFAKKSAPDCVSDCLERKDDFYEYLSASGQWKLLLNSYNAFHRPGLRQGEILRTGDDGEYLDICSNDYRNLIEHAVAMITAQRIAFEPKAANTDYVSNAQTILSRGLLEYYHKTKGLEQYVYEIVRDGFLFGEGFLVTDWNATAGDVINYDPVTETPQFEGDLEYRIYNTVDVIRDCYAPMNKPRSWYILRDRVGRYDYIEKYPHLADKLDGASDATGPWDAMFLYNPVLWNRSKDYITVYTLVHVKTPAVPEGRLLHFLDSECIFLDTALPYPMNPVHHFYLSRQEGSPFAYSHAWDTLPLQDAQDRLLSAVVTNNAAFAVQNITIPNGANIATDIIGGGLRAIRFNGDKKPEPLQLTQSAPETYNLIRDLQNRMQVIMAINGVTRGTPDENLKSGSALAMVQSMSVQFQQQITAHYVLFLEAIGTSIVKILQTFADSTRVALITGKNNRQYLKAFKGDDLNLIQRVYVDLGNALVQTIAGRTELATTMVNQQMIKTPEQLLEVMTTGRLEPILESEQSQLMLIRSENEHLSNGEMQPVLMTDDHRLHILEHDAILCSPEARINPAIVQATLDHIQQHLDQMAAMPPILAMLRNQPQLTSGPMDMAGIASGAEDAPDMPEMPSLPGSDLPFNPQTGE